MNVERQIVAFRLINLPVGAIAFATGVEIKEVKRILIHYGFVQMAGSQYRWRGSYEISSEVHQQLRFPDYIPLWSPRAAPVDVDLMGAIAGHEPIVKKERGRVGAYSGLEAFEAAKD